jgi:MoaA/NifB/PqqE/SkfB family radical SAM enzyme
LFKLVQLTGTGAKVIIFEGGEPTLWKDNNGHNFVDVLNYAKTKFLSVNFTTNGLNGLYYPADTIWISIDGLKETHNYIRGKGVFEKVLDNIKEFNSLNRKQKHTKIFANICINSKNFLEIPQLLLFLKKLVNGITIQFFYPYENNFELFLPLKQRIWILNRIIELKKYYNVPIVDSVSCLRDLKYNTWKCKPELLINAEPDGLINKGCYVKNRGEINCKYCGFAAHVELSKAFQLNPFSILTGIKTFF